VFEILRVTQPTRDLILERQPTGVIREAAERAGMRTMQHAGVAKVLDGTTSLQELRRVVFADRD
jgi:type IV pilus assembly protein PilB